MKRQALVLLLLCSVLIGCGRSEEQAAAEQAAVEQEAAAVEAARQAEAAGAQAARTARIAEAQGFIRSKFRGQSASESTDTAAAAHAWNIEILELDSDSWQWNEVEYAGVATSGGTAEQVSRLAYIVDPQELSSEVRVTTYMDYPAVRIDCRSSRCIRVTGFTVDSANGTTPVDRTSDHNLFPLSSSEDAQRVATAMNALLTEYGAGPGF